MTYFYYYNSDPYGMAIKNLKMSNTILAGCAAEQNPQTGDTGETFPKGTFLKMANTDTVCVVSSSVRLPTVFSPGISVTAASTTSITSWLCCFPAQLNMKHNLQVQIRTKWKETWRIHNAGSQEALALK